MTSAYNQAWKERKKITYKKERCEDELEAY